MPPSFEDVAPTAENLRRVLATRGLRPWLPPQIERMVAVLVTGRGVERSTWSDDAEVSDEDFERLLDEQPPVPDPDAVQTIRFRTLEPGSRSAKPRPCTLCAFDRNPKCPRCRGTGKIVIEDDAQDCPFCTDGRAPPCSACGGTGRTVPVKVVFGEDRVRAFAHVFLPGVPQALRPLLLGFFAQRSGVPDALAIDLADDFGTTDVYRGRRSSSEIHGHRADAALAQARTYLERIQRLPTFAVVRAAAFAWPFVIGTPENDAASALAVLLDEHGGEHLLG